VRKLSYSNVEFQKKNFADNPDLTSRTGRNQKGEGEEGTEREMGREDIVKGRQWQRIWIAHPLVSA